MIFFICALISILVQPSSSVVLSIASNTSTQNKALAGDLFFATCNLPECSTLELSLYDLATQSISTLYDFPFDDFEDGYVADSFVVPGSRQVVISLQYYSKPDQ